MIRTLTLTACGLLFFLNAARATCELPPSTAEMNRQYFSFLKSRTAASKIRLAVFPFQDESRLDRDRVLEKTFPLLFHELFSRAGNIAVLHPYLAWRAEGDDLADDARVTSLAREMGATHALYGLFQRQAGNQIRFFVKLADAETGKLLFTVLEVHTEATDRFFSVLADTVTRVSQALPGKKIKASAFSSWLKKAPSYEAYRYYVKGMENSSSYDESDLAVAKVWFEKAASLSYHFQQAYREQARSLLMHALIKKQRAQDFSLLTAEARKIMGSGNSSDPGRWLESFQEFAVGVALFRGGRFPEAQQALGRAVALLPEDGLAREYLARAYEGKGDPRAVSEHEAAVSLNPCLRD